MQKWGDGLGLENGIDWGRGDRDKRCFEEKSGRLGALTNVKEKEGEEEGKNDSRFWA